MDPDEDRQARRAKARRPDIEQQGVVSLRLFRRQQGTVYAGHWMLERHRTILAGIANSCPRPDLMWRTKSQVADRRRSVWNALESERTALFDPFKPAGRHF